MSLTVATCACGARFYRFAAEEWDERYSLLWCRVCEPDRIGASTEMLKLDTVAPANTEARISCRIETA